MNRILIILSAFIVCSCSILKHNNESINEKITIYGKIWGTKSNHAGMVYTPTKYLIVYDKNPKFRDWPDSLQFQYVKVIGSLEVNKIECDTANSHKMQGYTKYFIHDPQIELIFDDSTICSIDSMLGRCVEMRRFYNRLQIDKVLDSLVESDSIYTIMTDLDKPSTADYFKYEGYKTYFNYIFASLKYENITEYFVIKNFSCVKDSEYNIELTHVKIIDGVKTERKYHLTGNRDKIYLTPK